MVVKARRKYVVSTKKEKNIRKRLRFLEFVLKNIIIIIIGMVNLRKEVGMKMRFLKY